MDVSDRKGIAMKLEQDAKNRRFPRWPLGIVAVPAAIATWSGWVGLGALSGFGIVYPLPGIIPGFKLDTAITLPIGVEAYASYAFGAWLHPQVNDRARKFAGKSAIGAFLLGCLGQVAYHLLVAGHYRQAPVFVITLVACLPIAVLALAAVLTHLMHDDQAQAAEPGSAAALVPQPILDAGSQNQAFPQLGSGSDARLGSGTMTGSGSGKARRSRPAVPRGASQPARQAPTPASKVVLPPKIERHAAEDAAVLLHKIRQAMEWHRDHNNGREITGKDLGLVLSCSKAQALILREKIRCEDAAEEAASQ